MLKCNLDPSKSLNLCKSSFRKGKNNPLKGDTFSRCPYAALDKPPEYYLVLQTAQVLLLEFYFTAEFSLNANTADRDIDLVRSGVAD